MIKIEISVPTGPLQQHHVDSIRSTAIYLLSLVGDEMVVRGEKPKEAIAAHSFMSPQITVGTPVSEITVRNDIVPPELDLNLPCATTIATLVNGGIERATTVDTDWVTHPDGVELDVNGLPWNSKIHARTKTKTANGAWKMMRGVDMGIVHQVQNELRQVMSIPVVPNPPTVPVAPFVSPVPIDPLSQEHLFIPLMTKITEAVQAKKLTHAQIAEAVQSVGVPSLPLLPARPDLIPQVNMLIDSLIGA